MTVRIYRSSDGSAPTLSGTVGDLVNVLDKCLVAGYGSQTAAGWTKPYTGTNGAVFRPGAGLQYYLNVNDNGPGAGTGKEARVVGYETMTAFATGTNLFPTAAQMANGLFVRKSTTADATTRVWIVAADERTFYMWVLAGDVANSYTAWGFGEIYSFKTSDVGRMILLARSSENIGTSAAENFDLISVFSSVQSGTYLARDSANSVGAIAAGKMGDQSFLSTPSGGVAIAGSLAYKNPADNRIYLAPLRVYHVSGGNQIRGRLRGLWHFGHAASNVADGDTITGAGDLAGKTFLVMKSGLTSGSVYVVETSNTWETN